MSSRHAHSLTRAPGACRFGNGDRYTGSWAAGERCGQGRCVFANGDKYAGGWEDDLQDGVGAMAYSNGDRWVAHATPRAPVCEAAAAQSWDGNKQRCAQATIICTEAQQRIKATQPHTRRYQGEWKAGRRHGIGLMVFADGTSFKGRWDAGTWVQSAADPARCRLRGPGLSRAVAGRPAAFKIQVRVDGGASRCCVCALCGATGIVSSGITSNHRGVLGLKMLHLGEMARSSLLCAGP